MNAPKKMYRVVFHHRGQICELFARGVCSSGLYGFIEVSDLVFEDADSMVVDPTEEKLKEEFEEVGAFHVPMHCVIRIDEVERRGVCRLRDPKSGEKVTPLPVAPRQSGKD